jgi:oligopeptide transport system substrate-binding protein
MRRLASARAVSAGRSAEARLLLVTTFLAVLGCVVVPGATPSPALRSLTYQYVPFDQIDPQVVSDGEYVSGQNLLEGLVTPNDAGTGVVPATADHWSVSHGRTVYTFHIRKKARWSDGRRVTAQDFEWSYRRLLTPSTAATNKLNAANDYPPDLGIRNGTAFQLGQVTDWSRVGIKALDASHLRITLAAPNSSFLQEMALPVMVALPRRNLTAFPFSWQTSRHWVGNGPFVPRSWTPNSRMVMVPDPHYWDRRSVRLDRVRLLMGLPTDDQIRTAYQSGALDVARIGDPASFASSRSLAAAVRRAARKYSVNFLTLIPSLNPVLRDVRVRKAIALAIDRRAVGRIASSVSGAWSLIPSNLSGFDASVGVQTNVAKARRLLAAAGYPRGKGFPTLSVMTYKDDVLVRAVLKSLQRNLGIRAVQDVEAGDVYAAKRQEVQPASFVGFYTTGFTAILTWRAWVSGTYPPSHAELLSLSPADYTHYQKLQAVGTAASLAEATKFLEAHASTRSKHFAALAAKADATANAAKAVTLYKRAAAARQAMYVFIPFAYRDLDYVVRPGIKGVHVRTGYFTVSFKRVSTNAP